MIFWAGRGAGTAGELPLAPQETPCWEGRKSPLEEQEAVQAQAQAGSLLARSPAGLVSSHGPDQDTLVWKMFQR